MKTLNKTRTMFSIGIIALIAVIGFSMAACDWLLDEFGGAEITTKSLPNGTKTVRYNQTIAAKGEKPITWEHISGTLPDGLTLDLESGESLGTMIISGTPTKAGTFEFKVKASNSIDSQSKSFTIIIAPEYPVITTTVLSGGAVGAHYSQKLTATGVSTADQPITWTRTAGSLPAGLTLSSSGVISGTPTEEGTSNFTVRATNSHGNGTKQLSITIAQGSINANIANYYGTWGSTTGTGQPWTLTITNNTIRLEDKDGSFIQYTNVKFTLASNTNSSYSTDYPRGFTFTGTRTATTPGGYTQNMGFIALSEDGEKVYLGTSASSAIMYGGSIFTRARNPLFMGKWLVKNNEGAVTGHFTYTADTYIQASLSDVDDPDSIMDAIKGTYTTDTPSQGDYARTPTEINGAFILAMVGTGAPLFAEKLESKWYTLEDYVQLVVDHVEAMEVLAEQNPDESYFGEMLGPYFTLLLLVGMEEGTATYAFSNNNNTLTITGPNALGDVVTVVYPKDN